MLWYFSLAISEITLIIDTKAQGTGYTGRLTHFLAGLHFSSHQCDTNYNYNYKNSGYTYLQKLNCILIILETTDAGSFSNDISNDVLNSLEVSSLLRLVPFKISSYCHLLLSCFPCHVTLDMLIRDNFIVNKYFVTFFFISISFFFVIFYKSAL